MSDTKKVTVVDEDELAMAFLRDPESLTPKSRQYMAEVFATGQQPNLEFMDVKTITGNQPVYIVGRYMKERRHSGSRGTFMDIENITPHLARVAGWSNRSKTLTLTDGTNKQAYKFIDMSQWEPIGTYDAIVGASAMGPVSIMTERIIKKGKAWTPKDIIASTYAQIEQLTSLKSKDLNPIRQWLRDIATESKDPQISVLARNVINAYISDAQDLPSAKTDQGLKEKILSFLNQLANTPTNKLSKDLAEMVEYFKD